MGRGRIEIKKIENVCSRQVTFSKRRAGLVKKAKELAILCDAHVGVIIFSSSGKLYEFASSHMEQILSRYKKTSESLDLPLTSGYAPPPPPPPLLEVDALKAEVARLQKIQRQMMGKDLQGLSIMELQHLEHQLSDGILAVKKGKEQMLMEELEKSRLREEKAMLENEALRDQIAKLQRNSMLNHEPYCYKRPEEGDEGVSLQLELSAIDVQQKKKIPKVECANGS